jgi:hypothetical protein
MPMRHLSLVAPVLAVVLAAAPVVVIAPSGHAESGPKIGQPAPEITGGPWINSDPLTMQKLRGRVVYVEFWTYG